MFSYSSFQQALSFTNFVSPKFPYNYVFEPIHATTQLCSPSIPPSPSLCLLTVLSSPEQFMPDEWRAHARGMKNTADHRVNRNACCLPVCSRIEASQPATHTALISLDAWHLYGHGTCVGTDMGQSASSTTRRWAFWSIGKYIHHQSQAESNIFQCKCI